MRARAGPARDPQGQAHTVAHTFICPSHHIKEAPATLSLRCARRRAPAFQTHKHPAHALKRRRRAFFTVPLPTPLMCARSLPCLMASGKLAIASADFLAARDGHTSPAGKPQHQCMPSTDRPAEVCGHRGAVPWSKGCMHSTATPTAVIGPGRTESAPGPARGRTAAARWPRAAQGARNALGLWRACRATQAASTAQVGRLRAERMRASGLERGRQLQEDARHGLVGAVGDGRPPRASEVLLGALLRAARPTRASSRPAPTRARRWTPRRAAHITGRAGGTPKSSSGVLKAMPTFSANTLCAGQRQPGVTGGGYTPCWTSLLPASIDLHTLFQSVLLQWHSGQADEAGSEVVPQQATNHRPGPGPHLSESLKSSLRPAASPTKKLADRSAPGREASAVRPGTHVCRSC